MQKLFLRTVAFLWLISCLPTLAQEDKAIQPEAVPGPPPAFTIDYNFILLNLYINDLPPPPANVDVSKLPPPPKNILFYLHLLDLKYRYNLTNAISFTGMLPLKYMSMDNYPEKSPLFNFTAYGLGDPSVSANYTFFPNQNNLLEFSGGISFPFGSVNQRGKSPVKDNDYLPFPMQMGSGTFDILPAIFYRGFIDKFSWIGLAKGDIRIGKNLMNFKFGNMYSAMGMLRYDWLGWLAPSVRLEAMYTDKYEGNTRELTPGFLPDPSTLSTFNLDFVFNLSFFTGTGIFKNSSLDLDFSLPVVQVVGTNPKKTFGLRLGLHQGF
jgi:hypothetical protein